MTSDNTTTPYSEAREKRGLTALPWTGMSDKTCYLTLRKGSFRSFPAEYGRRVRSWGETEAIVASQRQKMQEFFHIGHASDPCRFPNIPLQCRGISHLTSFPPTAHLLSRDDFDAAFSALPERAMPQKKHLQGRVSAAKSHSSSMEMPQNRAEPGVDGPSPNLKLLQEPVGIGEAMTCSEVLIAHCVLLDARREPERERERTSTTAVTAIQYLMQHSDTRRFILQKGNEQAARVDRLALEFGCSLEEFEGVLQCTVDEVSVDEGGREIAVAEGTLDNQDVPGSAVEMCSEGVPERVRTELLVNTCGLEPVRESSGDLPIAKPLITVGEEQGTAFTVTHTSALDQVSSQKGAQIGL